MEGQKKIEFILTELGIKAPTFANNIGLKYQRILDIQIGKTKKISGEVANAIHNTYPQFSTQWLLTNDGDALNTPLPLTVNEESLPYTKVDLQSERKQSDAITDGGEQATKPVASVQQIGFREIEKLLNYYKTDCDALRQDCSNLRRDIEFLASRLKEMEAYRDELEQENDKLIRNEAKLQIEVNKFRQEQGLSPHDFARTRNFRRR